MEVFEIKGLDCSKRENRIKLIKEVKKILKVDEKPSREYLEKVSRSLANKYSMPVIMVKQKESFNQNDKLFVSVDTGSGMTTYCCMGYYEALCKHILLVKAYRDYHKRVNKFKG
jgi:hypothetical protein